MPLNPGLRTWLRRVPAITAVPAGTFPLRLNCSSSREDAPNRPVARCGGAVSTWP